MTKGKILENSLLPNRFCKFEPTNEFRACINESDVIASNIIFCNFIA